MVPGGAVFVDLRLRLRLFQIIIIIIIFFVRAVIWWLRGMEEEMGGVTDTQSNTRGQHNTLVSFTTLGYVLVSNSNYLGDRK